jgi:hypothetical protein
MAGKPGRSGRKSKSQEWSVAEIVAKSLQCVRDYIDDPNSDPAKRVEVAAKFALKLMPDRIEHTHAVFQLSDELARRLSNYMDMRMSADRVITDMDGGSTNSRLTASTAAIEIFPISRSDNATIHPDNSMINHQVDR